MEATTTTTKRRQCDACGRRRHQNWAHHHGGGIDMVSHVAPFLRDLRKSGITPARTNRATEDLVRDRIALRLDLESAPAFRREQAIRRTSELIAPHIKEIRARGGETEIVSKDGYTELQELDHAPNADTPGTTLRLLGCDGWRYYSSRFGSRSVSLRYLCGRDDSGLWAVRVPGTIRNVAEAQAWLEPATVTKAREAGREVIRQGDLYLVQMQRGNPDPNEVPWPHRWDATTRTLTHPQHAPVVAPWPHARIIPQSALEMGRSGRWGTAD